MTWAALAQQAVPIKQTTKSTGSSSAVAKPVSAGSSSGATPTVKKLVTSFSSINNSTTSPGQHGSNGGGGGGKFRKEDWYPIYIRGIRLLDEKELKDHLSKKFGELKFFKVNQNIALVDFVHQEAQRKALDAKETTLDGVTFALEPRESKTGNNFHNNSGNNNNSNNGGYRKFSGSGSGSGGGGQSKEGSGSGGSAKNKDKFDNKKINGSGNKKNLNKAPSFK